MIEGEGNAKRANLSDQQAIKMVTIEEENIYKSFFVIMHRIICKYEVNFFMKGNARI